MLEASALSSKFSEGPIWEKFYPDGLSWDTRISVAPVFKILDDAVVDDHGIALAARAQAELGAVHGEPHRLGELAIAVAQHQILRG